MFKAYGEILEELFSNAALVLSGVICQVDKIEHMELREVEVKGEDTEDLMFN